MTQRNKFKLVVYVFLLAIGGSLAVWLMLYQSALSRDYERLGQLRAVQAELAAYYARFNTYVIPRCSLGAAISACAGEGDRQLPFAQIADPLNSNGYQYTVGAMSDDDYRVNFGLEIGLAGLAPGGYGMTKGGIIK